MIRHGTEYKDIFVTILAILYGIEPMPPVTTGLAIPNNDVKDEIVLASQRKQ